MRNFIFTLPMALLFLIQSCTSKRINERPNLNLTGKAAEKEIEKFSLGHITTRGGNFQDEGVFSSANSKDLRPFMEEISPKSVEMLEETKKHERTQWILCS